MGRLKGVFRVGGNYINFLTANDTPQRFDLALGKGRTRLTAVKARWDAPREFRTNGNIRSA